ncbi:glycoside hydrolase family 26 protein [Nocardioides sp. GCM10027113]|uniref:glycoside hydrolase family 26 protein n=1 Tax=unclassified Nocardioides TaxID=2615069 RepID=UPI0036207CC6
MPPRPALRLLAALLLPVAFVAPRPAVATAPSGDAAPTRDRVARSAAPAFGAYVDGMQADPSRLADFEELVRSRTDIASSYYGYGDVFPGPLERTFADGGRRKVLVSWHMDGTRYAEWSAGRHDDYLDTIVEALRAHPHRVWVRPWPEMNGDWQPFQPTRSGERPEGGTYREFRQAWRHVVDHFREAGVRNVRWVFNPSADTYAGTTPVEKIWPGRRYVDVLGIDGFNWGEDDGWGRWRSFDAIFGRMYDRLTALHPTAPVWICEVSSKEPEVDDGAPRDPRRSKAAWTRRALDRSGMPQVRALIWFHALKERDWRANSSPGVIRALRRALADR